MKSDRGSRLRPRLDNNMLAVGPLRTQSFSPPDCVRHPRSSHPLDAWDSRVVSDAVWRAIMALNSAPSKMTMEESHFHVVKSITAPNDP